MTNSNRHIWTCRFSFVSLLVSFVLFCYFLVNLDASRNTLLYVSTATKVEFFGFLSFLSLYILVTTQFMHFRKLSSRNDSQDETTKRKYSGKKLIVHSLIAILTGFFLSYFYKEKITMFFLHSLADAMPAGNRLIFTSLPEAFFAYLSFSFYFGLILSSPIILFFIYNYAAGGLDRSKKILAALLSALQFLAVVSVIFYLYPGLLEFAYSNSEIRPMPSLKEYLSFSSKVNLFFAFVIYTPITVYFLTKYTVTDMLRFRLLFLTGVIIVGALITPPGLTFVLIVTVPALVLFEIAAAAAIILNRRDWKWMIGKNLRESSDEISDQ